MNLVTQLKALKAVFLVFRVVLSAGMPMNKEFHDKTEQSAPDVYKRQLLYSQVVGVKTNLVMDAMKIINLGAEVGLSKKLTLDLYANYNPWKYKDQKMMKMLAIQPELRYWFCDKFNGHFVGFHVHGGVYQAAAINMPWGIWPELKDHRFKGNFFGAGISYGYQWILAKHWNLEGNIGVGYARVKYEQFECKTCGEKVSDCLLYTSRCV